MNDKCNAFKINKTENANVNYKQTFPLHAELVSSCKCRAGEKKHSTIKKWKVKNKTCSQEDHKSNRILGPPRTLSSKGGIG